MTDKAKKWMKYEKRWKIRDIYFNKALRRHIVVKYLHKEPIMPYYAKKWVMSKRNDIQQTESGKCCKSNEVQSGKPFFVCRFGNTELSIMTSVLKNRIVGSSPENDARWKEWFERSCDVSGFFPNDISITEPFTDLMLECCKEVDMLAMWHLHMEDYVIEEYLPQADITFLFHLEPWLAKNPWSAALKGKKVLLIHPFEDTIKSQYVKRELLFPGREVLPEFELKTLKAVQTLAGSTDDRFENWFQALDYMYQEAMKIDFDIAIIGCGAYGFPLGAKLKKAGKQAIHLEPHSFYLESKAGDGKKIIRPRLPSVLMMPGFILRNQRDQ